MFAEQYLPIAVRRKSPGRPGGFDPAEFVDQFYWVKWREQNYFGDLEEYPHNWQRTLRQINQTLVEWGLSPYPARPRRTYVEPRVVGSPLLQ